MASEDRFKLQYIRRKSQCIALKTSFSKFTNDKSTPILLDSVSSDEIDNNIKDVEKPKDQPQENIMSNQEELTKQIKSHDKVERPKEQPKEKITHKQAEFAKEIRSKRKHEPLITKELEKKRVNKKLTTKSSKKQHDDDDFEIQPTVHVPDEPVPKFVAYNGKRLLPRSTPSNLHSWIQVMNKAQRKTVTQMGFQSLLNLKIQNIPISLLMWLEVSGSGNHLLIHVVPQYEVLRSSTKEDEGKTKDGLSEETESDEDVQIGKSNEEKKIESEENGSTQHVGQDNQVLVMSKSIISEDVSDDDVTTKAPIFDETPHTSNPDEDKSSQSDFTASMMIEYEREEAKILMQKENDILKDRQQREEDRKKEAEKVEESGQLDFNASMLEEYEKIENQILIDRQKESNNIKKSSNDNPSFDLHISQQTPYGDNILMGTQTVENVSKVITESEFLNTKEEEKPQAPLQSQEPKEDGKKERPSRYKRMAEVICSPYLERVVSMGEKRTILENNISSYLFSGYGDEWDEVFTISGKCNMPRFVIETLRPGQYLHINVIHAWPHILNHEEKFRSKDSIARLFST
ncbi:hypothetical protein L1987_29996 [Smallanthus sonchifolius]|uniref:Uncharacterized protein n=1 Tax=Smallanthus sonchifolius TaxID=185202 RepID=A0ACB9I101_9ASTR|nr:hypothetical protein L1987_29996 [Smallanthus sonchifolius]